MQVSIIIVNYNSSSYTKNCIASIYNYTKDLAFEIIVVDNNSKKEDVIVLKNSLKDYNFKLIESKTNLGFGGGNHLGYNFAKGEYLAFINNDAELTENSLLKLLDFNKTDKTIGCIGLPQYNEDKETFKYSYRQFIDLKYQLFGQKSPKKYYSKLGNNLNTPFEVDQVSGAFMFIKTEYYETAGGFDPNVFLFYEEMDICYRLKKSGFKTMFYPNSSFIHYLGKSSGNVILKNEFTISYLYIIQKNFSFTYYKTIQLILLLKYGFKSIIKPKKYFSPFLIVLKGGNSLVYSMRLRK